MNLMYLTEQKTRTTPKYILKLLPNEVFVFGSNESGIHGAGAAYIAIHHFGAVYGQATGLQGDSYAIPTKDKSVKKSLSPAKIKKYVEQFIEFAKNTPDKKFLVTEIGCGLAGHTAKDIAPLFKSAINVDNIHLPQSFWRELEK